jgi:hypothetical protein
MNPDRVTSLEENKGKSLLPFSIKPDRVTYPEENKGKSL